MGEPGHVVPIVPSAILFDLGRGGTWAHRPRAEDGRAAYASCVGLGRRPGLRRRRDRREGGRLQGRRRLRERRARVGCHRRGARRRQRRRLGGRPCHRAAVCRGPGSRRRAGPRGSAECGRARGSPGPGPRRCPPNAGRPGLATTIGVIATDATLTKAQCQKMSGIGHDGYRAGAQAGAHALRRRHPLHARDGRAAGARPGRADPAHGGGRRLRGPGDRPRAAGGDVGRPLGRRRRHAALVVRRVPVRDLAADARASGSAGRRAALEACAAVRWIPGDWCRRSAAVRGAARRRTGSCDEYASAGVVHIPCRSSTSVHTSAGSPVGATMRRARSRHGSSEHRHHAAAAGRRDLAAAGPGGRPRRQRPRATRAPQDAGRRSTRGSTSTTPGPLRWIAASLGRPARTGPAALAGTSALRAHGWSHSRSPGPGRATTIASSTSPWTATGTSRLRRRCCWFGRTGFGWRGQGHLSPPRLRIDRGGHRRRGAGCSRLRGRGGDRRCLPAGAHDAGTSPRRQLAARVRMRRRRLLLTVLDDAGNGVGLSSRRRYSPGGRACARPADGSPAAAGRRRGGGRPTATSSTPS